MTECEEENSRPDPGKSDLTDAWIEDVKLKCERAPGGVRYEGFQGEEFPKTPQI